MTTKDLMGVVNRFSTVCELVAGCALVVMMVLTACDITGRAFSRPIPGTYELVSIACGILVGLGMPMTSLMKGHITVDLLTEHVSPRIRKALHFITRFIVIILFLVLCYALVNVGFDLSVAGETSGVLSLPIHFMAYGIAGACFIEFLILICDMVKGGGDIRE